MTQRLCCCILGCHRSTGKDYDEWMCSVHWPLVSKTIKRRRALLRRKAKKIGWTDRLKALDDALWARAKVQATERSVGI